MTRDPDGLLRGLFDRMRREEAEGAPAFAGSIAAARAEAASRRRGRIWRRRAAWAALPAAAAAALVLWSGAPPGPAPGAGEGGAGAGGAGPFLELHGVGSWRAASDALLETPGGALLGTPRGWSGGLLALPAGIETGPTSRLEGRTRV